MVAVVDVGVDHALAVDPDAEDVAPAPADHPARDVHGLARDVEGLARPARRDEPGHRHPHLALEEGRKAGHADLAVLAADVALALQALEVLEDGRGAGDLQGRAQLADGRGVAVPEDEVLDGLEDLGLPEGQFPSQCVYHFVHLL